MQNDHAPRARSIVHPYLDFWLLGGASVAIWIIMKACDFLRGENSPLEPRFLQIGAAFSLLALVCNHPHFMISYQFGYGRGFRFVRQHWFALVVVPAFLIALFVASYLSNESVAANGWIIDVPNSLFEFLGVGFRFGLQGRLGDELMGIGIWLMYLTVGWHYSKQVFGCMMVYSRYDGYPLQSLQRLALKGSVFSVAILQFAYLYRSQSSYGLGLGVQPAVQSRLTPLELPAWLYTIATITTVIFLMATLIFVFGKKYRETGRLPSANFLIPWVALHVWWVPFFQMPEFTFLMVPFFHSLQYLPFAYRVGTPQFGRDRWYYSKITAHAVGILAIGFIAFEGLPSSLDRVFGTTSTQQPMFFLTAFAVFINIHHFFIDSVVWRMKDEKLSAKLFDTRDDLAAAVLASDGGMMIPLSVPIPLATKTTPAVRA